MIGRVLTPEAAMLCSRHGAPGCMCDKPPHDLTPSEVALARMLDAWEAWPGRIAEGRDTGPTLVMVELHEVLYRHGLISPGALTEDGAALRDRARKAGVL